MSHTIEIMKAEYIIKTAELKEANEHIEKLEAQLKIKDDFLTAANERCQIAIGDVDKLEAQLKERNLEIKALNVRNKINVDSYDQLYVKYEALKTKKLSDQLPTLDPQDHIIPPGNVEKLDASLRERKAAFAISQNERLRGVLKEKSRIINDLNHDYAEMAREYRSDQASYHRLMISCTQLKDFVNEHFTP